MDKKELWLKLKAYHFNNLVPTTLWAHIREQFGSTDAFTKAFADKIARKHHWKNAFALKAVAEYKKFVYLGVVSDFLVTPSKIIDVVWHEHLLFTKAYRDFCNDVIYYSFDHYPELVPMEDQTGRYSAQYLDTLNLYQSEFGITAPNSIWGSTKYDENDITGSNYESRRKKDSYFSGDSVYVSDTPLYQHFEVSDTISSSYPEFSGFEGGDFGGGGSSGDWGSDNSSSDSGSDSGSDGGGDGGGCSGGGCGGGGD